MGVSSKIGMARVSELARMFVVMRMFGGGEQNWDGKDV